MTLCLVNCPQTLSRVTLLQTLAAANVYHAIVRGVENARRTAFAALEAAGAAVNRAEDRGGDNLGVRAELSRVRSEDLFQASPFILYLRARSEIKFRVNF